MPGDLCRRMSEQRLAGAVVALMEAFVENGADLHQIEPGKSVSSQLKLHDIQATVQNCRRSIMFHESHDILRDGDPRVVQVVDDYSSAALGGRKGRATKRSRFSTFPPYLVLQMQRYFQDQVRKHGVQINGQCFSCLCKLYE